MLALIGLFAFAPAWETLNVGDTAPMQNSEMKGTDSKMHSLKSSAKENGLLVIFSCNTCPFVIAWEDQYPVLGKKAKENKIGMLLVNSNEAKRSGDDSMDQMVVHYKEAGYNTPYVLDAGHKLADAFGARTTPHVFLFDKDMKLVFKGSINDMYESREKTINNKYTENAMRQLAAGEAITTPSSKEYGCSIKRMKK
jgi:hypothetical protein